MSQGEVTIETNTQAGVLGDGALHAGKGNMAMIRRALRDDWPIPPDLRKTLVAQMGKILESADSDRDCIAAAKVLVAADSLNAKREATDLAAEKTADPSVQVNVGVSVQSALQSLDGKEPEYQEWRRERALRSLVGPALVGCNGYKEQILSAAPSTDAQPGGDADNTGS